MSNFTPPNSPPQQLNRIETSRLRENLSKSLDGQLTDARAKTNFHDPAQDYYPTETTKRLVKQALIDKELSKFKRAFLFLDDEDDVDEQKFYSYFQPFCEPAVRDELARWVYHNAHRTFATAVVSNLSSLDLLAYMVTFKNAGFTDKDLPKEAVKLATLDFAMKPAKAQSFCDQRWKFLAPVFSPGVYDYDLESDHIFPFTKDLTKSCKGAFGVVSKVKIHEEHQKHLNMEYVAIKEIELLKSQDMVATNQAWEDESRALRNINKLNHSHLTKCIAAIRRGDHRYFMFPWANGGNLQELWTKVPRQAPTAELISQTLKQLKGLVEALHLLHNGDGSNGGLLTVPGEGAKSIRHGDLKPENILRFLSKEEDRRSLTKIELGNLRIADMGLAKQHVVETALREKNTSQRYGTIRYEAPEAVQETGGRTRLYDIWSMGCITLEFIIWLLHGNDALEQFHIQVGGGQNQACQYFIRENDGTKVIHPVVSEWMNHIRRKDPECAEDSALRGLLDLVQARLLVVSVKVERRDSFNSPAEGSRTRLTFRATADEFRTALNDILKKAENSTYLFTGKSRDNVELPNGMDRSLHSSSQPEAELGDVGMLTGITSRTSRNEYSLPPLKDWEFPVDNAFAGRAQTVLGSLLTPGISTRSAKLCERCMGLDFWVGGFTLEDRDSAVADRAKTCELCSLLNESCKDSESLRKGQIVLEREQSNLKLANMDLPLLSILRSPALTTRTPVQIGLPLLPRSGSDIFFKLLQLWIKDCDDTHLDCRPKDHTTSQEPVLQELPTRLIDVGTTGNPTLRLVETRGQVARGTDYMALSHPWGDTNVFLPFSTLRKDPSHRGRDIESLKNAIPYPELPNTFKDAVDCTRALGVQYIWIDSICIIQGKDGDFADEAKHMEQVYSGAYCVLAASRAANQHSGFLDREPERRRPQRKFVTIQRGNEHPFYICQAIDDFSGDVIEGSLNKRGWVLQERALARRTIYFTENQTYFECGKGIRCETLASMHNTLSDFLGDPNFPEKAMRTNSRALKIEYFQDLYRLYSRLHFSKYEDRPFAIAGLEKRLRQAFGTKGGYGIFDDGDKQQRGLFHRSILWQRGEDEIHEDGLRPIKFSPEKNIHVPSWSWMAYEGGIDYTDPPGGKAEWELDEISEPWTHALGGSAPQDGIVAISALVRDFAVANRQANEVKLVYDTGRTKGSEGQRAQCVIVAKEKGSKPADQKRHYVLLVAAKQAVAGRGRKVYERIGAGYILGKYIALSGAGVKAEIH